MEGRHFAATGRARPAKPRQAEPAVSGNDGCGTAGCGGMASVEVDPGTDLAAAERMACLELLSHELRTPVTSIHAAATILRARAAQLGDDLRSELIEDIADETERLTRVIDDLLVLAQLDAGLATAREPLLLQRLVPLLLRQERQRHPGDAIELRESSGALPVVRGDELAVKQVVCNLVAEVGRWRAGAPVSVELGAHDASGAYVRVIHEHLEHDDAGPAARSPSHRLDPAGDDALPTKGSIGLQTCARLAKAMGGYCWTRRRADGRTERGLWLPAFASMPDD